MQTYASPSPDARELVSELEFVWDQIKSNVPSSSSSSPHQTISMPAGYHSEPSNYPGLGDSRRAEGGLGGRTGREPMRELPPGSLDDEEALGAEAEEEEFVDAPDSQPDQAARSPNGRRDDSPSPPASSKQRPQPSRRRSKPPDPRGMEVENKWRRT
ncbi:hypothetical protein LTS18_008320, partial [Coniosporium uncinatum]